MDVLRSEEFSAWVVTVLFITAGMGIVVLTGWGESVITHWFNLCYIIGVYIEGII